MKRKRRIMTAFVCAVLTVTLPASVVQAAGTAEPEAKPPYEYKLKLISAANATTLEFELCVSPDTSSESVLSGGNFALRFPKRMGGANVVFKPGPVGDVDIGAIVPPERLPGNAGKVIQKDSYIAFSWMRNPEITAWKFDNDRGLHLLIGTFTFSNVQATPFKTDIGQMNFLKMTEAIPTELPPAERGDPAKDAFNMTVWNAEAQRYKGYYRSSDQSDPVIKKTDIGFSWEPPLAWQNAFTALSYNPKNSVTATLCDAGGTAIAEPISTQKWIAGTTTADSAELYSATDANKDKGTGAYFTAVDFNTFKKGNSPILAVKDTKYILRLEKPSHLTREILLTATDTNFANCTGLPTDGDAVYLPAGDINPKNNGQPASFGDGVINMADRAIALGALGKPAGAVGTTFHSADIDGDGRVTIGDLTILMSPENFRKIQVKEGTA